jgi:hypothetical protein
MNLRLKQRSGQKQEQAIEQKVDQAYALDTEIKEKTKVLKAKKSDLLDFAKTAGVKKLEGNEGQVSFSDETKTVIDARKLFDLMTELGMQDAFFDCVSVKVGEAKQKVGEIHLEAIIESQFNTYAKMTFKKNGK